MRSRRGLQMGKSKKKVVIHSILEKSLEETLFLDDEILRNILRSCESVPENCIEEVVNKFKELAE